MKVDVIVIGSGLAGLAIAAALGRQKLKAIVIGPDIATSSFDSEYILEDATITSLPSFETSDHLLVSSSTNQTLKATKKMVCVNSKSLYQRFLMSCADNGVGMMHGKVDEVVSYRKLHRVDWYPNQVGDAQLPKEELFAPVVIDASGSETTFSPAGKIYTTTFRRIFRTSEVFDEPSFFNFSRDKNSSFSRAWRFEDGRIVLDEIAFSSMPIEESTLRKIQDERLDRLDIEIESESFHSASYFHEQSSTKMVAFGAAARMGNPFNAEATSEVVNIAPELAKTIAQNIEKPPAEINALIRDLLFFDTKKRRIKLLLAESIAKGELLMEALVLSMFENSEFLDFILEDKKISALALSEVKSLLDKSASKEAIAKLEEVLSSF